MYLGIQMEMGRYFLALVMMMIEKACFFEMVRKDGSILNVLLNTKTVRDRGGRAEGRFEGLAGRRRMILTSGEENL